VTDSPLCDQEVALHAGDVTSNVYVAWESDRNGHGNLDIYARIINPTSMPDSEMGPAENLALSVQGQDIGLSWTAPVDPDLDHFLIYRSENQTAFDFTTPHHDTSGDVDPLNTSWTDPGAAGPAAPAKLYYTIRPVDSNGRIAISNGTTGKWTKTFNQGLDVFSLPLEPDSPQNVSFYVNDIPNVQFIRWMDPNGRWVTHDKGMGPGVNDAPVMIGKAYEIYLDVPTSYVFNGRPASTIRYQEGFGDLLASRYSLGASVMGIDVTLNWTEAPGAEYYLIFRTRDRSFSILGEPVHVSIKGSPSWVDSSALTSDGEYFYMVVPMSVSGELGSSSYSVCVSRRTLGPGVHTYALPVEIEEVVSLDSLCAQLPDLVGISYMTSEMWKFHARDMPTGVFDSVIQVSSGYQISVSEWNYAWITFIGW
jgi:hypothetical protein